jgi:hypothetical protein
MRQRVAKPSVVPAAGAAPPGLSDEQKREWVARCSAEPAFRDALLIEVYVSLKNLEALAAAAVAQLAPAMGMLQGLPFGLGQPKDGKT